MRNLIKLGSIIIINNKNVFAVRIIIADNKGQLKQEVMMETGGLGADIIIDQMVKNLNVRKLMIN